jgi:nucleoside-diphosphate-sugar epimerase
LNLPGVTGIVHVAQLLTWSADPSAVIPHTVSTLINGLKAAANESSVKRFAFTSSSVAVTLPKPNQEFSVDENSWNDEAVKVAYSPPPYEPSRGYIVYAASKTESERAAWNFMRENQPDFVFNSVLPNFCFGELLSPKNQPGSTGNFIRELYFGNGAPMRIAAPPRKFRTNPKNSPG